MRLRRPSRPRPTRTLGALLAAVALVAATVGIVAARASADSSCGIAWGSQRKVDLSQSAAPILGVRAGHHDCFDRLVFDIGAPPAYLQPLSGYDAWYPTASEYASWIGTRPLVGDAGLVVALSTPYPAPPAVPDAFVDLAGLETIRQVTFLGTEPGAGSGESITAFAVGVRARLPFRLTVLPGPDNGSRVVLDIAHEW